MNKLVAKWQNSQQMQIATKIKVWENGAQERIEKALQRAPGRKQKKYRAKLSVMAAHECSLEVIEPELSFARSAYSLKMANKHFQTAKWGCLSRNGVSKADSVFCEVWKSEIAKLLMRFV